MKKLSWKKASILGLVLMAASAVTAAILPANSKSNNLVANDGTLDISDGHATCNPAGSATPTCSDTESAGAGGDSGSTGRVGDPTVTDGTNDAGAGDTLNS